MKIGFVTKYKQALVYYHHQKSPTNNKKNKKLGGPRFRTILRAIYTSLKNLTPIKHSKLTPKLKKIYILKLLFPSEFYSPVKQTVQN